MIEDEITGEPYTSTSELVGATLAISGTFISCLGVVANNLILDHIMAMYVWRISNIILFFWAFGLYRKYWDGGISGAALCGMYAFFAITNEYGLEHV